MAMCPRSEPNSSRCAALRGQDERWPTSLSQIGSSGRTREDSGFTLGPERKATGSDVVVTVYL